MFIHELKDFNQLLQIVSVERSIIPQIVEKDYWLTHCLWGLKNQDFNFELKGGTSLSKGFDIIHRFSEDVDIKIYPPSEMNVKIGKNHDKLAHKTSREKYFDWLTNHIRIDGVVEVIRDRNFDDPKSRNAGIRLHYPSHFSQIEGLKNGILLEVGFDTTVPNDERNISSWVHDKVKASEVDVMTSVANNVKCYLPEYTFVEKLQTISTKFRQQQASRNFPINFIRHYYDVYQLLNYRPVLNFINTKPYFEHKDRRFRQNDEKKLTQNEAFILSDPKIREFYHKEYDRTSSLYFKEKPSFDQIMEKISEHIDKM